LTLDRTVVGRVCQRHAIDCLVDQFRPCVSRRILGAGWVIAQAAGRMPDGGSRALRRK
jgi:hypothetical protein